MRLIRLEIFGFKSFAKRTEIVFDDGITAIVGPNGCGKSNIADAIRWVLGEQNARALRGSKMEDVIFNGTEKRKAQAYCEVALTFDNREGTLPVDFTEVTVKRRVYRSGESEYFINQNSCRLKDINELFRDTGIGREGYSIIGQGRVEEILSNKSNDRRAAFEEAAGVMKYRVRKEEAERKLDNTRKNLVRLHDILEELALQLEPLEQQSASAREYLKLREELKEIEINVFLYQYDKLNERIESMKATLEQLADEINRASAKDVKLSSDLSITEERERKLNTTISDMQAAMLRLSSQVQSKSGESKVANEKIANILLERERLERQIKDNSEQLGELRCSLSKSQAQLNEDNARYIAFKDEVDAAQAQSQITSASITEREELLEKQKADLISAMNRLSDAKSRISRLEAIKGTLFERLEAIAKEEESLKEEERKLDAEHAEANNHLQTVVNEYSVHNKKREAAIAQVNEANTKLHSADAELRTMENQIESNKARLKVLEDMKRSNEGYYQSVKNILRDCERDFELHKCVEGVVATLISVPKEYETAIEMALGAALQNIVTPTEQEAKHVIEHLRSRDYGRATLLPISAIRSRLLDARELVQCDGKGFIGVASNLIKYDEKYRGIMENLLGRTIIVTDIDSGIAISKRTRNTFKIATLKGDILNPGGSMTGGSTQKREFSLVGREREISELRDTIVALHNKMQQTEAGKLEYAKKLDELNALVEALSKELHARDVELATHKEKLQIIKKYVDENKQALDNCELSRSQVRDNLDNIADQYSDAEATRTSLESGNVATQDDIKKLQEAVVITRTDYARQNEDLTQKKVALMALNKELSSANADFVRMKREADTLERSVENDTGEVNKSLDRIEEIRSHITTVDTGIQTEQKELDELTERMQTTENERNELLMRIDEMRRNKDDITAELTDLRDREHKAEMNFERSGIERTNMQDRIWSDYELTYENAQSYRKQMAITASHVRVDELKRSIRELGDVNVSAIEDYKNVKERHDSLDLQYNDLTTAEGDLMQLIGELTSRMEVEFKNQFALIQQNFSVVFSELFGGGQAELVLADKSDILNCDIDIIAQPPGKKLQLLSLLSGGERALTAIALLFSILKLKPTAFCILDEIESSLDDVNVSGFAEYIRNYSSETQFILITHRKGSMEVCNALYGVSMEEKGVSKVISARFDDTADIESE